MYQIEFTRKAERDLDEAADWYEKQGFQLGLAFLERFEEAYDLIEKRPESTRYLANGARYLRLKNFRSTSFLNLTKPLSR